VSRSAPGKKLSQKIIDRRTWFPIQRETLPAKDVKLEAFGGFNQSMMGT
jgi:hypothetical protein